LNFSPPSVFTPFFRRFGSEGRREFNETAALYRAVKGRFDASRWSRADAIEDIVFEVEMGAGEHIVLPQSRPVRNALRALIGELLALETTVFGFPEIEWDMAVLSMKEMAGLRHLLRQKEHFLANEERSAAILIAQLVNTYCALTEALARVPDMGASPLSIPLHTLVPDLAEQVEHFIGRANLDRVMDAGLFEAVRVRLYENVCQVSGLVPYQEHKKPYVTPPKSGLPPEELIASFLGGTPFAEFLQAPVPFALPQRARMEHHWIVAGSGHGKTQAMQTLILGDLERVAQGEASVVVMDSQGDLIRTIAGLACFAPGGPLHGKLVLIDPTDIEYPVALNLFDIGMDRINQYSPLDRERLINGVLELYDFVLASLLSAGLTQKQSLIFRYITRLMLHIPNATIHTFRELMEKDGYRRYEPHIQKLTGTARAFFETEFNSKEFEDTKRQVVRRLWGILENQTFERMFSHPRNKLDLFTEMNAGKVILINTAKELLKQNGSEIFGRFFVAMIAQAAQERATLPLAARTPTYVYIDECQDYLDANVSLILEQARKFNIGMVLAHQYIGQLSPKLLESFSANTSIKFAGGVSDRDARAMAPMLRTKPEFIEDQKKGEFAAFVRNVTDSALSLRFPLGYLEAQPRMDDGERAVVIGEMRERYAVHYSEIETAANQTIAEEPVTVKPVRIDPDHGPHTRPSSEW
jgi:hypothetical protein